MTSRSRGGGLAAEGEGPSQGAALRPGVRGRGLAAEGDDLAVDGCGLAAGGVAALRPEVAA